MKDTNNDCIKNKIDKYKKKIRDKINCKKSWKFWSLLLNAWIYSSDNDRNKKDNYNGYYITYDEIKNDIPKEFISPGHEQGLFCFEDGINNGIRNKVLEIWKDEINKLIELDSHFSTYFISLPINLKFVTKDEVYKSIRDNFYKELLSLNSPKDLPYLPYSFFASSIRFWSQQGERFGTRLTFYNFYGYEEIMPEQKLVRFLRQYESYFKWTKNSHFKLTEFVCEDLLKKCKKPIVVIIKRIANGEEKVRCEKVDGGWDLLQFEIGRPSDSTKSSESQGDDTHSILSIKEDEEVPGIIDMTKVTPLYKWDGNFFNSLQERALDIQIQDQCKEKECIEGKRCELKNQFKVVREMEEWEYIYIIPASEYLGRVYRGFGIWFLFSKEPFSRFWLKSLHKLFNAYFLKVGMEDWSINSLNHALRSAVAAIITDSFAHNIAAHSLVALVSYFEKRLKANIPENIRNFLKNIKNLREPPEILETISKLYNQLERKDEELVNFLKFLRGKSSFWAGALGFQSPGGIIMNFYDIFTQFVDNSLFLGTIALDLGFEGVSIKVNNELKSISLFNEGVFRYEDNEGSEVFRREEEFNKLLNFKNYDFNNGQLLPFKCWKFFLPGGVAGLQSLYTFWENILRNIKHSNFKNKVIPFSIEIQDKDNTFEITSYLDVEIDKADIVQNIQNDLKKGFVDDNNKPIMGGNSLAILCAGFLMGLSPYEINNRIKRGEDLIKVKAEKNRIKYVMNVWKGEDFIKWKDIKGKIESGSENLYRFKILTYEDENDEKEIMGLEKPPIRRVKAQEANPQFWGLYNKWLNEWIFEDEIIVELVAIKKTWQKSNKNKEQKQSKNFVFRHTDKEDELKPTEKNIGYRSHGIFGQEFGAKNENGTDIQNLCVLVEILGTKITVVDDEILNQHNSLTDKQKKILEEVLDVKIFKEEKKADELLEILKIEEGQEHFLVIHLSNVETAKDSNGNEIWKNNLNKFGDEVLKKYKYLVFTSGRNREIDKSQFDNDNAARVFFIHRENFLHIFEWANQIPIEAAFRVKYGLIKLLVGV